MSSTQETQLMVSEQLLWPGQAGGKELLWHGVSSPQEGCSAMGKPGCCRVRCHWEEGGWEQAEVCAPQEAVRDLCFPRQQRQDAEGWERQISFCCE